MPYALLLLAGALAVASCGGGGDGDSSGGSSSTGGNGQSPGDNHAPTISGSPAASVMAGSQFSFTPSGADADGDVLTYSVENLPSWASFDAGTGRITGTPASADVGTYSNVRISVTDGALDADLAAFSVAVVDTSSGSAVLSWSAPTLRTDGTPLTDLAGYKIYWGTSSGKYTKSATVQPGITTYVVDQLTPATYYFSATAIDSKGVESSFSNEAKKTIM